MANRAGRRSRHRVLDSGLVGEHWSVWLGHGEGPADGQDVRHPERCGGNCHGYLISVELPGVERRGALSRVYVQRKGVHSAPHPEPASALATASLAAATAAATAAAAR